MKQVESIEHKTMKSKYYDRIANFTIKFPAFTAPELPPPPLLLIREFEIGIPNPGKEILEPWRMECSLELILSSLPSNRGMRTKTPRSNCCAVSWQVHFKSSPCRWKYLCGFSRKTNTTSLGKSLVAGYFILVPCLYPG